MADTEASIYYGNCSQITLQQLENVAFIRGIVGLISTAVCIAIFVFELIYLLRPAKLRSTETFQRFFVYLTFSTLLYVSVLSLYVERYFHYSTNKVCQTIGILDRYFGAVQLIFTLGTVITIPEYSGLLKLCGFHSKLSKKEKRVGYVMEVMFVLSCFTLPLVINWIPFISVPYYGEVDPWCSGTEFEQINCRMNVRDYLQQYIFLYLLLILVSLVSIVGMTVILVYHSVYFLYCNGHWPNKIKCATEEFFLHLSFLLVLVTICAFIVRIIIIVAEEGYDVYGLWICYAVVTPIGGTLIPVSLFLYLLYDYHCSSEGYPEKVETNIPGATTEKNNVVYYDLLDRELSIPNYTKDHDTMKFLVA